MTNIKDLLKGIKENIPLAPYTTFKIGGLARYFYAAKNKNDVTEAIKFAKDNKLKFFILGGGSKILVSDKGFDGLVIKMKSADYKLQTDGKIMAQAGVPLAVLVRECLKNNLAGLEWAAGIPGITVGGAIYNNAGAHGKSMANIIEEVEVMDFKKGDNFEIKKISKEECEFSYRSSIFRRIKKYVILGAVLRLNQGSRSESKKIIAEYLKKRKEKQPMNFSSAGSVFKNPVVKEKYFFELVKQYPELKAIAKNNTIPAAWLVEELDLKGKKIGGAEVSEKHGNFIINKANAKATDVITLISLIKQKIRARFDIQLEEEIQYVGF